MSFSKTDNKNWENSDVMTEYEKIFNNMPDPEFIDNQYENLDENLDEEGWEDNFDDEKKIIDSSKEFLNEEYKKELHMAYNNKLFLQLQKISEYLADKSNIKAAYIVEKTILNLKDLLREG
jgi:hypothetical protein